MKETTLLALIDAIVKDHFNSIDITGNKGARGLRGRPGRDFDFEDHRVEIEDIVKKALDTDKLKLKFEDLLPEEIELLKGDKGTRGQRGKPGKDFIYSEHEEVIHKLIIESCIKF